MAIEIVQSGVAPYDRYLNITGPCNRAWAPLHSHSYTAIRSRNIGEELERACGSTASLSAFNKLQALRERAQRSGLVLYLDADAMITSKQDVVGAMIRDGGDGAMLWAEAGGSAGLHDINNGVFLWNLSHPLSRWSIDRWMQLAVQSRCNLRAGVRDQRFMHKMLKELLEKDHSAIRKVKGFNYHGPHIKHFLRARFVRGGHDTWDDARSHARRQTIAESAQTLPWCELNN